MNESKVKVHTYWSGAYGDFIDGAEKGDEFVTHADYKALEEDHEALVDLVNELQKRLRSRNEELASLKARVRELVDKGYESASAIAMASAGMQKILEGIQ